jgi:hypothetical protein
MRYQVRLMIRWNAKFGYHTWSDRYRIMISDTWPWCMRKYETTNGQRQLSVFSEPKRRVFEQWWWLWQLWHSVNWVLSPLSLGTHISLWFSNYQLSIANGLFSNSWIKATWFYASVFFLRPETSNKSSNIPGLNPQILCQALHPWIPMGALPWAPYGGLTFLGKYPMVTETYQPTNFPFL